MQCAAGFRPFYGLKTGGGTVGKCIEGNHGSKILSLESSPPYNASSLYRGNTKLYTGKYVRAYHHCLYRAQLWGHQTRVGIGGHADDAGLGQRGERHIRRIVAVKKHVLRLYCSQNACGRLCVSKSVEKIWI